MEVRYSAVRKGIVASGDLVVASNPEYAVAVGLLAKGTKNCALYIPPKPEPKIEPVVEPEPTVEPTPEPVKEKPKKEKKKGPGLFGRLTKGIDTFGKTLSMTMITRVNNVIYECNKTGRQWTIQY